VDWNEEQACFRTFLQELAYFYSPCSPYPTTISYEAQEDTTDDDNDDNKKYEYERHQITHVMFPAMKRYANFPSRVLDGVKQLASTDELYKTFERC
jgi:DNA mismatch repair protein MLH1